MFDLGMQELESVQSDLLVMTNLVHKAITDATTALLTGNLDLAEQVIGADEAINSLHSSIEEQCFQITSTQAPVARKLRSVMSAVRIAASLERMGDLAVHIAKQVRLRYPKPAIPEELHTTFSKMGEAARTIVEKTSEAVQSRDASVAEKIADYDDELDQLHRDLFVSVLSAEWNHGVEAAIDVTLLSRFYERFGDHSVSVGRRLVHTITGEPYSH